MGPPSSARSLRRNLRPSSFTPVQGHDRSPTASVAVSLAVVVTGALRNALLAYAPAIWEVAFPASTLLLYGAFFTVAFAAV